MAIRYNERTRTFHLYNDKMSYIMRVMENEQLENLYYGKRVYDECSFDLYHRSRACSPCTIPGRNIPPMVQVITGALP